MFQGLMDAAKEIWREGLEICDRYPTISALPLLLLGAWEVAHLLFLAPLIIFVVAQSPRAIVEVLPSLLAMVVISALFLWAGLAIIRRKLSKDPGYWKRRRS